MRINFFNEDLTYNLKQKTATRLWISSTINQEGFTLQELNFIFCSDDYLLNINQQYLKHNTYTDIVTFDNATKKGVIVGDIFISIDRIKENSKAFNVSEADELHRVIIHGTLHLLGYKDKSKADKALMTQKEDQYLSARDFIK
ncbi:MAG: rRNA maturation factor [Sphingobacteriales bacterium]|nr:rRNA maturation factor [Sphingobacteriales bacterium]